MESKTLSKAENLKGLQDLLANPFYQQLVSATEHQVQVSLDTLLNPNFFSQPESTTKAVRILGEMAGMRYPHLCITAAIAALTEEVKAENDPKPVESIQPTDEV